MSSDGSVNILKAWDHSPGDEQDFDIRFGRWLRRIDDTPRAVDPFTLTAPPGIEILSSSLIDDETVKVWVGAVEDGQNYIVSAQLFTTGGRKKTASIMIRGKRTSQVA